MSVTAPAAAPCVELRDVSKRFGRRWAISRLSLRVEPGEAVLVTGHNGSGKTTLLRLIATAAAPTAGELRVLGLESREHRDAIRARVGMLSHSNFLYEDLTARQNLLLLARLLGRPEPRAETDGLLGRVGLQERSDHPVREFSAGMRKRLAIARLLLKAPALALLDEPFGELDPAGVAQMEDVIRQLKQGGTTLFLATHLVEQGLALCSRRLHLSAGRAVNA
jgi:heme exporter protein A